jgi:selenocysteine lyase/cysteine desulfurase
MPTVSGGGMIVFVDPIGHRCLDDPLVQEGGTPAIVESIRTGLVVALKQAVGTDLIQAREQRFLAWVLERWRRNPTWSCWAGAARGTFLVNLLDGRPRDAGRSLARTLSRLPPPGQRAAGGRTRPPVERAELARRAGDAARVAPAAGLVVAAPRGDGLAWRVVVSPGRAVEEPGDGQGD